MRKSLFEERSIAVRMLEVRFWTRKGVAREAQVPSPFGAKTAGNLKSLSVSSIVKDQVVSLSDDQTT